MCVCVCASATTLQNTSIKDANRGKHLVFNSRVITPIFAIGHVLGFIFQLKGDKPNFFIGHVHRYNPIRMNLNSVFLPFLPF